MNILLSEVTGCLLDNHLADQLQERLFSKSINAERIIADCCYYAGALSLDN